MSEHVLRLVLSPYMSSRMPVKGISAQGMVLGSRWSLDGAMDRSANVKTSVTVILRSRNVEADMSV